MSLPRTLRDQEVVLLAAVAAGHGTLPAAEQWAGLSREQVTRAFRLLCAAGLLHEEPRADPEARPRRVGRPTVARTITPAGRDTLAAYLRARPALLVGRR